MPGQPFPSFQGKEEREGICLDPLHLCFRPATYSLERERDANPHLTLIKKDKCVLTSKLLPV
jgi:hypothetical protein